ncbi:MAG: nuclear transport factor 2 family protein [candidate division Zixibacteria bacterium]|nr:nuclear transport factor 2 family protein [candidate division Zixibacteria bacterium]
MNSSFMVNGLFKAIDEMDVEVFCAFLADDASFKFGNSDTVTGKAAIKEYVAGFFSGISGMSHTIDDILTDGNILSIRGEVTYIRKDSSRLTVPFANYFKLENELIKSYQIYADVSQLFAPVEAG